VTTQQDTPREIILTATDVDGDPLTFNVITPPDSGSLSGTAPNQTYTPDPGYTGTDSFSFKANDGTDDSKTATVSITITSTSTELLEFGIVTVDANYLTVNLENTYVSPVVVCSVQYQNNNTPVVTRVSNVTSTSFDVRLEIHRAMQYRGRMLAT
jgi:hypothetical protein